MYYSFCCDLASVWNICINQSLTRQFLIRIFESGLQDSCIHLLWDLILKKQKPEKNPLCFQNWRDSCHLGSSLLSYLWVVASRANSLSFFLILPSFFWDMYMLDDVDGNGCDSSVSQICILLLLICNSLVLDSRLLSFSLYFHILFVWCKVTRVFELYVWKVAPSAMKCQYI